MTHIMPPPPLLGYNNNVRHRGRIFHIQTEDSGVASPRIMTHLFADGGRIVKSKRTDYSEHLERDDMAQVVKNMMKEQHKAMFIALRSGDLDDLIGFSEEPAPGDAPGSDHALHRAATIVEAAHEAVHAQRATGQGSAPISASASSETSEASLRSRPDDPDVRPYAVSRPAAIFSVPPPSSGSIFGDLGLDEKSLDDAILSYLAEDDDEPDEGDR